MRSPYHRVFGAAWAAGVVGLSGAASAPASAADYAFVNIADDTQEFSVFGVPPAISAGGTVAWEAMLRGSRRGVFVGSGGPTTTVADNANASPFDLFGAPSINSADTVAFSAILDGGGYGLYTWRAGQLAPVVDSSGPFQAVTVPSINSAGTLAFYGLRDDGSSGVFTSTGGAAVAVVDSAGPLAEFYRPHLNDTGAFTFGARDDAGVVGIHVADDAGVRAVANSAGPFQEFGLEPTINNLGTVAFRALLDDGTQRVVTASPDGTLVTVADTAGAYNQFHFNPAINNDGTVAFLAITDDNRLGIFTGDDPDADKVIAIGDPLFGSTVRSLSFERGLNDAGDIAFTYRLADGRSGIGVAEVVPEPAALGLAALAGVAMLRRPRPPRVSKRRR